MGGRRSDRRQIDLFLRGWAAGASSLVVESKVLSLRYSLGPSCTSIGLRWALSSLRPLGCGCCKVFLSTQCVLYSLRTRAEGVEFLIIICCSACQRAVGSLL